MTIDRHALVSRHDVTVTSVDTKAFLTVGNGETAFTADVTGLQTLNATYTAPPLQTMTHAEWGWHVTPPPVGVDPLRAHARADAPRARESDRARDAGTSCATCA